MDWDSYFAELEGQFADDMAAEQAALDVEKERLRLARLDLLSRLRAASADRATTTITTIGGHQVSGTMRAVGADWCGIETESGIVRCVRTDAIRSFMIARDELRRTLMTVPPDALTGRATFGYVLRGWARRRTPVLAHFADASVVTGTIDRAGSDHCDLALHDAHTSRRDGDVSRILVVPFHALDVVSPLAVGASVIS